MKTKKKTLRKRNLWPPGVSRMTDFSDALRQLRAADLTFTQRDPKSDDYIGHSKARQLGIAVCICADPELQPDFDCPFHGR